MALTKPWDKRRPNLVSKKWENRRAITREKRRRGTGREKEEKPSKPMYGTMTFIMDLWNFKVLYG